MDHATADTDATSAANPPHFALLFSAVIFVAGCVAPAAPVAQRIAPTFDYTPAANADPMSARVTFAVVGSRFETPVPLFEHFSSNMGRDFAEILTARGYTIRGPFDSYDDMTFPDKEGSNLILQAEVDFTPDISSLTAVAIISGLDFINAVLPTPGASSSNQYNVTGSVRVQGRVTLVVAESLTNEKMWTKSVDIEPIDVALAGTQVFDAVPSDLAEVLKHEDQLYTDLGRALATQYVEIMEKTYAYLDPREMAIVDRQADTLRERKRY